MPSGTIPAAVLAMADVIWNFEMWSSRTKHVTLPFDEDATPLETHLSAVELEAVRALAYRVRHINGYARRVKAFMEDNDEVAKAAWIKWFQNVHPRWNMLKEMEILLDTYERHPRLMVDVHGGVGLVSGRSQCEHAREIDGLLIWDFVLAV
jgi:hypothetical protein